MSWSKMTWYYQHSLDNLLFASSTSSGFDVGNLLNTLETDCWRPTYTGSHYVQNSNTGQSITADYLAFTEHNLHTIQANVSLQFTDQGSFSDNSSDYIFLSGSSYSHLTSYSTVPVARKNFAYLKDIFSTWIASDNTNHKCLFMIFGVTSGQSSPTNGGVRYNIDSNHWTTIASYNTASGRTGFSFYQVGDGLCIHGGFSANSVQQDLIKYFPDSNAWTVILSGTAGNLMGPRMRHNAVRVSETNEVFFFGGMTAPNTAAPLGTVFKYNYSTGSWTQVASMPAARYDMAAFKMYSSLAIVAQGGYSSGDIQKFNTYVYWVYSNAWTEVSCGPQTIGHAAFAHPVDVNLGILFYGGIGSGSVSQGIWFLSNSLAWTCVGTVWPSYGIRDGGATYHSGDGLTGLWSYLGRQTSNTSLDPNVRFWNFSPTPNYSTVVGPFIPDTDHETIQVFSLTSANLWRMMIVSSGPVAPYISIAHWGMKTEIGFLDAHSDPHMQEYKINVNVSQTGYVQGYWDLYCERRLEVNLGYQADSFYTGVIEPWWVKNKMKNFFVQWEPTEHSSEVWYMRPESQLKAPFAVGDYRNIKLTLIGRRSS